MFGKDNSMTLNEAQKHVHRMLRERKALEFMAGVIDAAVWAEDGMKNAELAVENAREQVRDIEDRKVQLEEGNLVLAVAQEDMQARGRTLSETLVTYEKSVELRLSELDVEYEEAREKHEEALATLSSERIELQEKVEALRAEKVSLEEKIGGMVDALRTAGVSDEDDSK